MLVDKAKIDDHPSWREVRAWHSAQRVSALSRPIYLPQGRWLGRHDQVYQGPRWLVEYRVALDELATFELLG